MKARTAGRWATAAIALLAVVAHGSAGDSPPGARPIPAAGPAATIPAAPPAATTPAAPRAATTPAAPRAAAILEAPPATPDPAATYVFYLHGRIVQQQGRHAVSAEHGPYYYDAIVERLADPGLTVVAAVRPPGTDPVAHAAKVAAQIEALLEAGLGTERITVIGASMGAWIALQVSNRLDRAGIGYVAMGICGEDTDRALPGGLHGDVLSIHEAGDPLGGSCGALFDRSPGLGRRAEIRLETGLGHGFLYRPLPEWIEPALGWVRHREAAARPRRTLRVTSADSPAALRDRLAADPDITEVILAAGTYRGGFTIPPARDGANRGGLVMRAETGARVIVDGATRAPKPRRERGMPGVVSIAARPPGLEAPALFDADARVRYAAAADRAAVERFPGMMLYEDGRILFHPPEGSSPKRGLFLGAADRGLSIERPGVTVRGLTFRNFLARAKYSAAVWASADDVVIEDCAAENSSIGFALAGARGTVRGCSVRDVGNGVYVIGSGARVERCRLFKRRDDYRVPTYAQDDTAIQFYDPARGGTVLGNLAVGFGTGLLLKAQAAPYRVERNTFAGAGVGTGFLATLWDDGMRVSGNVIEGFAAPVQVPRDPPVPGLAGNCYARRPAAAKTLDPGSVVGDPLFADPVAEDYRIDADSACLKAVAPEGIGAFAQRPGVAAEATAPGGPHDRPSDRTAVSGSGTDGSATATPANRDAPAPDGSSDRAPRTWHVDPEGRDGAGGTADAPVRTIQFAVDRALPGDTILVHPGLYADPVRFPRGGAAGRPITLAGTTPADGHGAILDGRRRHDVLIDLDDAPHVILRDLEVRWYRAAGIRVRESADVTVSGCRIWNAAWRGTWPTGNGIEVERSPRFRAEGNLLFAQERGLFLYLSPQAVVTRNTAVGNLYGGVQFVFSIEGSTCRDNSFAFQGNDALAIVDTPEGLTRLAGAVLDHNNYGMTLREQPPGTAADRIVPRGIDAHLNVPSKALIYYEEQPGTWRRFTSLAAWREFSGKDAHSIAADPLFVSTAAHDFRLGPGSPNRGAGSDGGSIGALP